MCLWLPGTQFGEDAGDGFDAEIEGVLTKMLVRRVNIVVGIAEADQRNRNAQHVFKRA